MILPSKHLSEERALIVIGSEILLELEKPRDVSELWDRVRDAHNARSADSSLSYDWFTLALTFLFAVLAVEIRDGLVVTTARGQNDSLD